MRHPDPNTLHRLAPGRTPMHPGRFLATRFLAPLGVSQDALARTLTISRRRVNELVLGKRALTPDTALRLSLRFGLAAEFWLGLQVAWDLHQARRRLRRTPR
jgi:antitoxin HigA-1